MTRIIILAAGKGTRMNSDLPKALVPLNGRPMIKYLMDEVAASGIDSRPIIVVSPDNKDIISRTLEDYAAEYVVQDKALGTGHAVACARAAAGQGDQPVDNIVVLYGDHPFLKRDSINKFADIKGQAVTIAPTVLTDFDGWHQNFYHWGRIVRGMDGSVERIVEFKDASDEEKMISEVNPGFMRFDREWLWRNIDNLKNDNKPQEYYLTDMVKIAFDGGEAVGAIIIEPQEAMGVNSQEELRIAEELLNGR